MPLPTYQPLTRAESQLVFTIAWIRDDTADALRAIGRELADRALVYHGSADADALLEAAARTNAAADVVQQLAAAVPGLSRVWKHTETFSGPTASPRQLLRAAHRLT